MKLEAGLLPLNNMNLIVKPEGFRDQKPVDSGR